MKAFVLALLVVVGTSYAVAQEPYPFKQISPDDEVYRDPIFGELLPSSQQSSKAENDEYERLKPWEEKAIKAVKEAGAEWAKRDPTDPHSVPNVKVELYSIEFSTSELAKLGSQKYGGEKGDSLLQFLANSYYSAKMPAPATAKTSPTIKFLALIDKLSDDGLVETAGSASVIVTAGLTAKYHVGGEYNYRAIDEHGKESDAKAEYGTWLEVDASAISEQWITLRCKYAVKTFDEKRPAGKDRWAPLENGTEGETTVTFVPGRILCLGGLISKSSTVEREAKHLPPIDTASMSLLTATIVHENAKVARRISKAMANSR